MGQRARRVFLSHTVDLRAQPPGRSYLSVAEEAVTRARDGLADMKYFPARDARPVDVCRDEVLASDIYVGIIGLSYGTMVDGRNLSYTEFEFQVATEASLPRLVFVLDGDDTTDERQRAFRR